MIESVSDKTGAGADLKAARRKNAAAQNSPPADHLPPHDDEAEQSILGCCLGGSMAEVEKIPTVIKDCLEQFGEDQPFYNLNNQSIWNAIQFLHAKGFSVDAITVQAELKARGNLEQVGGMAYLSSLQDKPLSMLHAPAYISLVWEKFVVRQIIQDNLEEAHSVFATGELSESFLASMEQRRKKLTRTIERGGITPKNLCQCSDFADAYFDTWFKRRLDDYGYELPFGFPMRLRPSEWTLLTGDNGSGKSSMLGQILICYARQMPQGEKIVIASMEVPPEITLWIMARQLMGIGKLEQTEDNTKLIGHALAWLNERFLIYNFLGITDWRELLNTFRYAQQHHNAKMFEVDSVMRIGIQDDDYAMQGLVACEFADFCVSTGSHMISVIHENKGDGNMKNKVRGSKQWTDNAHNVCQMRRNENKAEKIEDLKNLLKAKQITPEKCNEEIQKLTGLWDAKFVLNKQRWPGSQQNASRWLFFNKESLQYHEHANQPPIDYLK